MAIEDVLDDREAEPGAAHLARARRVDPVEPFGQPGQLLPLDALAVVAYRNGGEWDRDRVSVVETQSGLCADRDISPGPAVLYRIVDKVLENLCELVRFAEHFGEIG